MNATRSLFIACWLTLLASPALAAESPIPLHITGTVTALDGTTVTVSTNYRGVMTGTLLPGGTMPIVGMQVEYDVVEADRLIFVDAVSSGEGEER